MVNKMERAGVNVSMGGKKGYSQAGNHSSFRGFDMGVLEVGKF